MARRPTQGQRVVLGIVRECGPITAAELAYHLPGLTVAAARGQLRRLELRRLVDATYTNVDRGRGYVLTAKGEEEAIRR